MKLILIGKMNVQVQDKVLNVKIERWMIFVIGRHQFMSDGMRVRAKLRRSMKQLEQRNAWIFSR